MDLLSENFLGTFELVVEKLFSVKRFFSIFGNFFDRN